MVQMVVGATIVALGLPAVRHSIDAGHSIHDDNLYRSSVSYRANLALSPSAFYDSDQPEADITSAPMPD